MQSNESPREARTARPTRPWFLVAALILAWFVGAQGATSGCATVAILRDGVIPDRTTLEAAVGGAPEPAQALVVAREAAVLRAQADQPGRAFPLGVARLILCTALVMACATAIAGRPGARGFAIQAVLAYAAFAGVEYALSQPIRDAWVPEVTAAAAAMLQEGSGKAFFGASSPGGFAIPIADGEFWYWRERLRLGLFDWGSMALALAALGASRSRAFFEAAAAAAAQLRQREDDEP